MKLNSKRTYRASKRYQVIIGRTPKTIEKLSITELRYALMKAIDTIEVTVNKLSIVDEAIDNWQTRGTHK